MAKYRNHVIKFKRQIAQELPGERRSSSIPVIDHFGIGPERHDDR